MDKTEWAAHLRNNGLSRGCCLGLDQCNELADLLDPQPVAPEGYELVVETRLWKKGEWVLSVSGTAWLAVEDANEVMNTPQPILRKLPVAPEGYELTGEYRQFQPGDDWYLSPKDGQAYRYPGTSDVYGKKVHLLRRKFQNGDVVAKPGMVRAVRNGHLCCMHSGTKWPWGDGWSLATDEQIMEHRRNCPCHHPDYPAMLREHMKLKYGD